MREEQFEKWLIIILFLLGLGLVIMLFLMAGTFLLDLWGVVDVFQSSGTSSS